MKWKCYDINQISETHQTNGNLKRNKMEIWTNWQLKLNDNNYSPFNAKFLWSAINLLNDNGWNIYIYAKKSPSHFVHTNLKWVTIKNTRYLKKRDLIITGYYFQIGLVHFVNGDLTDIDKDAIVLLRLPLIDSISETTPVLIKEIDCMTRRLIK